jgi:hypothetical protein
MVDIDLAWSLPYFNYTLYFALQINCPQLGASFADSRQQQVRLVFAQLKTKVKFFILLMEQFRRLSARNIERK